MKSLALAFAATAILATAVGGIVTADPGTALDAPSDDQPHPTPAPALTDAGDDTTDDGGEPTDAAGEPSDDESFPQSLEKIVYEERSDGTPVVTFVTDDHRFSMQPTVVGGPDGNMSIPDTFDFTSLMQVNLGDVSEQTADGNESDGTTSFEMPENATGEPVEEFDPDVPVSAAPKSVSYDADTNTLTVVTTDGTHDLHVALVGVSVDGTVKYQFDALTTYELDGDQIEIQDQTTSETAD